MQEFDLAEKDLVDARQLEPNNRFVYFFYKRMFQNFIIYGQTFDYIDVFLGLFKFLIILMFSACQTSDFIDVCLGLFKSLIILMFRAVQNFDYINV